MKTSDIDLEKMLQFLPQHGKVMLGKDRILKLRQGDEFLHLEELAVKIRDRFIDEGLLKKSDHPEEIHEPEDTHVLGHESDSEVDGEDQILEVVPKEVGNE